MPQLVIFKVGDHSIETGFTEAFVKAHPDKIDRLMDDYIGHLAPPEIFLRHVLGRQGTDTRRGSRTSRRRRW